jgi:hypothetical protein
MMDGLFLRKGRDLGLDHSTLVFGKVVLVEQPT